MHFPSINAASVAAAAALLVGTLPMRAEAGPIAKPSLGTVGTLADNLTGANAFGIANGPYTGVDTYNDLSGLYTSKESGGSAVAATGEASSVSAVAMLGSNGLAMTSPLGTFSSSARNVGDSEWADYGMITGPSGAGPVTVTFMAHLIGTADRTSQAEYGTLVLKYALLVGNASATIALDNTTYLTNGTTLSKRPPTESVSLAISLSVTLPLNTPFGMVGEMSGYASYSSKFDFSHTGMIDQIVVPTGYGVSAHGVALDFNGIGYNYPPASPAAVPEPPSLVICGLAGLILLGYTRTQRSPILG